MKHNKFDKYLIDEVLPLMRNALLKEDRTLRKHLSTTIHNKFYVNDIKGITSYNLTERSLQYIIYRELCSEIKILPEDLAYGDSKKRLDLSIYKNIVDREKCAEIGIELKQVKFNKNGEFSLPSIEKIIEDYVKIKNVCNENKYLLLTAIWNSKILPNINDNILNQIDNRLFRGMKLQFLSSEYFITKNQKAEDIYYHLILLKLVKK